MIADISKSMITIEKVKLRWDLNPILTGEDIDKFLDNHKGTAREYFDHAFRLAIGNFMSVCPTWWKNAEDLGDEDFHTALSTTFDVVNLLDNIYDTGKCQEDLEIVGGDILNAILLVMFRRFEVSFVPEYWRYVSYVQRDKIKKSSLYDKEEQNDFYRDTGGIRTTRASRILSVVETRNFKETTLSFNESTGIIITRYSFQYKNPCVGYIKLLACLLRIVSEDVRYWDVRADENYRVYTAEEYGTLLDALILFRELEYNTIISGKLLGID